MVVAGIVVAGIVVAGIVVAEKVIAGIMVRRVKNVEVVLGVALGTTIKTCALRDVVGSSLDKVRGW
jgi:Ca2+/H+ antiporter